MSDPKHLRQRIDEITAEITPHLIGIRRKLHANPELGFEEFETSALVAREMDELGLDYRSGFGKTGVAAVIGKGNGRTVGIRGDMDALPIQETASPDYKSRNPGKMHACGHDAHTAIALGVSHVLARLSDALPGRALMVFQPAEEGLGGARAMLDDGLFDWVRPDVMLGYHNWPLIDGGTIGWHAKIAFASTDPFDITITGQSGHGAHPHLAVDPIVAAGSLVSALQSVVSREIAPLEAAVVTVGSIKGGSARNQIPDRVTLEGTTRSQNETVRQAVKDAVIRVCKGISLTHRVTCVPDFLTGVPAVVNDPDVLYPVLGAARAMLGDDKVFELPQGSMGSEDYAEFAIRVPSAHLRIGSRLKDRATMLHRSDFDLDEACIPTAVKTLAAAAIDLMEG